MIEADVLLLNAAQLVTCAGAGAPKRGAAMRDVGILENGALAITDGLVTAVGSTDEIVAGHRGKQVIDASGKAVSPGLVDSHTHVVYGGDRVHEFEMRVQGATYMQIMAAGGGIVSTMRQTRQETRSDLVASARRRLDDMLALGSTTVEVKSGYGLDTATELKMLQAIAELDLEHACDLVPTFLGAHTVPPEYKEATEAYVALVVGDMLPIVVAWYGRSHFAASDVPLFIDVFCEDHAFDVAQSRRILEAGLSAGLRAKIHVDQFNRLGGVAMAVALGIHSADHLDVSGAAEIAALAASDTIAVPLPAVNFNLAHTAYADARGLIDAGAVVALATDINPGSAPCPSLPLVMAMACRYQRLLPAEALSAVTINAAHAIGLGHRVGSLEVGKQADFLLLKEPDYRHLAYFFGGNPVAAVFKRGRLVAGVLNEGISGPDLAVSEA